MNNPTLPTRLRPYDKHLQFQITGENPGDFLTDSYSLADMAQAEIDLLEKLDSVNLLGRPDSYVPGYPSIRNVFTKVWIPDVGTRYGEEWDSPIIEHLAMLRWEITEKIDGLNIRVGWDGVDSVELAGREHKRGNLPGAETGVPELIAETFAVEKFAKKYASKPMTIFVEAYGPKIGPRGRVYGDRPRLAVLDVVIDGWWLLRPAMGQVADSFGLECAPLLGEMPLDQAIVRVAANQQSRLTPGPAVAEGVVARAPFGLLTRDRKPILVKIKNEYFHGEIRDGR